MFVPAGIVWEIGIKGNNLSQDHRCPLRSHSFAEIPFMAYNR